ncbi:phosphoadenylyl-sulfate reductase [Urechidicola croceus]|uniref:Adenosine 5'-phosphosulfate reductase n=1 Tax=Urechidicola croceus TaxID=1850246 RepID=A0A1D8P9B8_9FLAO|nr:phosphoadenylyl-sulfate reductase [Urechidicola croceus]AOW21171.1 phosphoadenosine phosphosulfate reductase [Urechidicola croceus]
MEIETFDKDILRIEKELLEFSKKGLKIFLTSSFQTHSIPLLHLISRLNVKVDIYFINTGFHFVETHNFKDTISKQFKINIKSIESPISKINQTDKKGFFYYTSDTNYCCHLNKVLPTEKLLDKYDVWISGVRKDQNSFRKDLSKVEATPNGKLRYHPILDWNSKKIFNYRKKYNLPSHPLEEKGYFSIGCQPCTVSIKNMIDDQNREGRWVGQNKTECGLHTNLIKK